MKELREGYFSIRTTLFPHVLSVRLSAAEALRSAFRDRLPPCVQANAEHILLMADAANAPKPDNILDAETITKLDQ